MQEIAYGAFNCWIDLSCELFFFDKRDFERGESGRHDRAASVPLNFSEALFHDLRVFVFTVSSMPTTHMHPSNPPVSL